MYKSYDQLGAQPTPDRDLMDVLELSNSQHKKHILSTHRIVCIDIYADWCGPCKQTAPDYSLIASKYSKPNYCAVVKYNLEKMLPIEKANIHGIPVFEFYVDGKQVDQIVGADIPKVEEKLKNLLQGDSKNQQFPSVEDLTGPVYNRNSIRNNRIHVPQTDSEPYQSNTSYNQSYGQGLDSYSQQPTIGSNQGLYRSQQDPHIRYQ